MFDLLANYWRTQITEPPALAEQLHEMEPTREQFAVVKQRLGDHWRGESLVDCELELAALYYFNVNTSYGPYFLGWPSDVYLERRRYSRALGKVQGFRAPSLSVSCASFEESIPAHSEDFLYCDPPYYLDDGSTFIGMYPNRNFPVHSNNFDHERLRDLLLNEHRGGFVLCYNDCATIRRWYARCEMESVQWQYTFGQGDTRIGKNREAGNGNSREAIA